MPPDLPLNQGEKARVAVCLEGCGIVADPKHHFLDTGHTIEWRDPKLYGGPFISDFVDVTGHFTAEIQIKHVEGGPAMVQLDIESGSLLDYDARRLGEALCYAADECERRNRA